VGCAANPRNSVDLSEPKKGSPERRCRNPLHGCLDFKLVLRREMWSAPFGSRVAKRCGGRELAAGAPGLCGCDAQLDSGRSDLCAASHGLPGVAVSDVFPAWPVSPTLIGIALLHGVLINSLNRPEKAHLAGTDLRGQTQALAKAVFCGLRC